MKKLVLFFMVFFLFSGCLTKQPSTPNVTMEYKGIKNKKTKKLIDSFREYWQMRVEGNYKKSYQFELPYQRYIIDYEKYRKMLGLYAKNKVILVDIVYPHKDIAIVTRKMQGRKKVQLKKDKWIYVNGKWYHKFFQTIFPPLNEQEAEYQ